jgi:hypothetical protein
MSSNIIQNTNIKQTQKIAKKQVAMDKCIQIFMQGIWTQDLAKGSWHVYMFSVCKNIYKNSVPIALGSSPPSKWKIYRHTYSNTSTSIQVF